MDYIICLDKVNGLTKKKCRKQCEACKNHEKMMMDEMEKTPVQLIPNEKGIDLSNSDIVNGDPLFIDSHPALGQGLVFTGHPQTAKAGKREPQEEDLINKPNHYHKGGIDIYEIMQAKCTPEEYRGFCKGNILKYVLRESMKGGVQDLEKMKFNAERLLESYKGIEYVPEYKKTSDKSQG
jgi:Protein of unknwon function (DUF3310)